MAKERNIICAKSEMNIKVKKDNKYEFFNYTKDEIQYIRFDKCTVKKLFRQVPTEKIEISVTGNAPIIYYQIYESEFFNEYKESLLEFAQNNRIKLYNNTGDSEKIASA